jgi:NADH-quinone oxidoreductase subunit L
MMPGGPASFALAALLLPAASFLTIGLLPPVRRSGRPAAWLSIVFALAAVASAILAWQATEDASVATAVVAWLPGVHGPLATVGVLVDSVSSVMLLLVTLVSLLVQVYSLGYLSGEPPSALGRYYAFQSLFAFSMMGVVLAPNLLQLFVCWELVGVCSFLLIGFWYRKPEAARAALKAFWITKAGDVGLVIGIVMLHGATGTFDLLQLRFLADNARMPLAGLSVITFCIYLGAMGKSAQFPLHVWLPDAMEGPTPVSALIHAATMVTAGVYLLTRLDWLFALTPQVLTIVAWNGAFTALLAAILACVQTDIKRVLAYSTVSQLGYMMAAIGAGFAAAGFLHLLTHGVFKALLFLGAGAIIHAVHSNEITAMGGLSRRMPQTLIVFLVGTLSLAGVPLFAGFFTKEQILATVWTHGLVMPFVMLLLGTLLTAFYMFRVVFLVFFADRHPTSDVRHPTSDVRHPTSDVRRPTHRVPGSADLAPRAADVGHAHDPSPVMTLPLWILAMIAMAIGVGLTFFATDGAGEHPAAWLTPTAVAAAFAGILLAWLTYQRRAISADTLASTFAPIRYAALRRFWLDDLFLAIYRGVLLAFSRGVGWIDRYLVDGVLNVVSAWTLDGGDRLRRMQTGKVQDYVFALGFGLLALIVWMGVIR